MIPRTNGTISGYKGVSCDFKPGTAGQRVGSQKESMSNFNEFSGNAKNIVLEVSSLRFHHCDANIGYTNKKKCLIGAKSPVQTAENKLY